jgi:hemoglobin/transferrin/lactoferrin receptor protein
LLSLTPLAALLLAAAPPPEEASRLDGIVVTAGRSEQRSTRVAPAVTALDAGQIERKAPQTVAELLRGQVGAYVQQTTPGQGNVIVRGLKGSEVLHLVDGVRLNNAFFRNAPNQYLALVDAQQVERVELVRGPLSTLYGGDAMGGVLQLFTPEPRFAGSDWQSRGRLRLGGGTADDMRLLHVRQAWGREGLGFSAALTRQDYGERRVGSGERLPFTGFEAEAASLRWLYAPSSVNEWLLGVDLSRQPSTPRHDALVPGFGQSQPENAEFAFEPNQRRLFHLRQRWLASSPLWDSLQWQLARQVVDDDRRSRDFGSSVLSREQNRSTQDSFSAQANRSFDSGSDLVYGGEWLDDTVRSARQRRNLASGGPWQPATARYPDGSRMRSAALYGQIGWALGQRTRLNAGLRYSRYRVNLPAADRGVGVDLGFEDLSGSLGLVQRLDRGLSLVANLGRGFRPPNVFDLGTLGARPGNRFNLPNPDLGPERLLGADLGLKLERGPWQGEAFVFRSRYADRIGSVLLGQTDEAGRELVQSRNALRMDLSGVEAGLRYRAADWSLGGSLTWTRGDERLDGSRDPADRIPPLAGRIDFAWTPTGAAWDAGLSLRYADRQDRLSPRDVLDPRIDPAGTPGFVVFDAQLTRRLREGLDLRLRLDNLGDRRYREHGSGLDEAGRNLVLLLDWRY